METTLACDSLHPSMHNTSIFKEGIEEIEDDDHTALENAGPFGSRMNCVLRGGGVCCVCVCVCMCVCVRY